MTDQQKIEKLIKALNDINKLVYASIIEPGSDKYFRIRLLCTDTIRECGGKVD